ncbi:MAG: hypothetical protein ACQEVA_17425, partial [Myxococcota bacterium]
MIPPTLKRGHVWLLIALLAFGLSLIACDSKAPEGESTEDESSETEHSPNNGEWCAGHSIPESHCTKCHPELV